jgi:hypothetical protein
LRTQYLIHAAERGRKRKKRKTKEERRGEALHHAWRVLHAAKNRQRNDLFAAVAGPCIFACLLAFSFCLVAVCGIKRRGRRWANAALAYYVAPVRCAHGGHISVWFIMRRLSCWRHLCI